MTILIQEKITADCERLEREMEQFQTHISTEVDRVMARTQFTIRGPRSVLSQIVEFDQIQ